MRDGKDDHKILMQNWISGLNIHLDNADNAREDTETKRISLCSNNS